MSIARRPFGKTGLQVSVLGFGAAPAAFLSADAAATARMVESLLDAGLNVLDTAAMYPGSEAFIGQHLAHRRKDYVLISKCGTKVAEIDAPAWSPQLIEASVDRALRLTRTDALDVMLLHSCDQATLQKGDALAALVKARDAGKVRHVGYSGDNAAAAYAAQLPDVAVIETSVSIVDQANIDVVLPVAEKGNVGIIAKRPIGNAVWRPVEQHTGIYANYNKPYIERFGKLGLSPGDLGFSGDAQTAWPEIAIRFTLSFPQVSTAIIGTTKPTNAQANLSYVAKGPLPADVVAKIRAAFKRADPDGKWPGLT